MRDLIDCHRRAYGWMDGWMDGWIDHVPGQEDEMTVHCHRETACTRLLGNGEPKDWTVRLDPVQVNVEAVILPCK